LFPDGLKLLVGGAVLPFVGIVANVVELFGTVAVLNVPPLVVDDGVAVRHVIRVSLLNEIKGKQS